MPKHKKIISFEQTLENAKKKYMSKEAQDIWNAMASDGYAIVKSKEKIHGNKKY